MSKQRSLYGLVTVIVLAAGIAGCKPDAPEPSLQGWKAAERNAWYNADQGSRLIPLKWLEALEQPAGDQKNASIPSHRFAEPSYLATFRILPPGPGATLPIGFAIDNQNDAAFVRTNLHWI